MRSAILCLLAIAWIASGSVVRSASQIPSVDSGIHSSGSTTHVRDDPGELSIAVTPPEFDDVGAILTSMGWQYTEIQFDDLQDYDFLSQFDVIFITCSEPAPLYSGFPRYHSDENIANLERFVREGGTLYASDYAYPFIDYGFPGYVHFADVTQYGKIQTVTADVVDPGLAGTLNSQTLPIEFDTAAWISVESVSDEVVVHLSADYTSMDEIQLSDKPISMSFPYGEGRVVYTAFHASVQTPEDARGFLADVVQLSMPAAIPATPTTVPGGLPAVQTGSGGNPTLLYVGIGVGLCLCGLVMVALAVGAVILLRRRSA